MPNIKGHLDTYENALTNLPDSGALSVSGWIGRAVYHSGGGGNVSDLYFNASKGCTLKNSAGKLIYSDDIKTVQPEAYAVNIWRRTS